MESDNNKLLFNILTDQSSVPNVLLDSYKEMGLSSDETLFLVILLRLKSKKIVMNFKNIAKGSVYTEGEIMEFLAPLIDKGFLSLKNGDEIVLDGLIEKFMEAKDWNTFKEEQKVPKGRKTVKEDKSFSELYHCFEQEMGRPLSPMEGERISYWYKSLKLPAELIKEALQRAVLYGKFNLRYIDSILDSWSRQGICSLQDLERIESQQKNVRTNTHNNSAPKNRIFRGEQNTNDPDEPDIVL